MGCEASYVLTWPTFFFFIIWSPIFGMIAAGYTGKRFSGLHTCLYRAPCKKQNKGWIAYLITKMLLFLLAYVGYKLYQWKYTKTSPKNSTKLPVLRLAWLCITYTTAAVPLSIYYMVETLVRGNYSPFLVKKIRANVSEMHTSASHACSTRPLYNIDKSRSILLTSPPESNTNLTR